MNSNKYIIGLYSSNVDYCIDHNLTREEYNKIYENSPVYVMLCDEKIITKCKNHNELYEKNLHSGCFIETIPFATNKEVKDYVNYLTMKYKLKNVTNNRFKEIESIKEDERKKEAFALAEKMIASEEVM